MTRRPTYDHVNYTAMDVLYLGNKLSKHGYTMTTIETLAPLLESLGYRVTSLSDKKNKFLRLCVMVWAVLKNRSTVRVALIDTYSTLGFYYAVVGSLICRLSRLAYIPLMHGGNLPDRLKRAPFLCKLIFSHSKVNVAPSRYLQEQFVAHGFPTIYIPNSIEMERYDFKKREAIKLNLLWVRSMHRIYNPQMAIQVVRQLRTEFDDVHLCMIGPDKDGSLAVCQKMVEELELQDSIEITGGLSKDEWIARSANYDVFINTTTFDNMPVSVIEALALGFPVVSTNVGGLPWLLDHGEDALLVESNDVQGMCNAIKEVCLNPHLAAKLSVNARKKGESFDWASVSLKWRNLINSN